MVKLGLIQTGVYSSNEQALQKISQLLKLLGKKETDIITLPEQWLKNNKISDFDMEFVGFKKIAKDYSMTIIPGAFYERKKYRFVISSPVIGPKGEIIGIQEKIHPFDYEQKLVKPGREAKVFQTNCKFGIIICYDMVFSNVANSLVKKGAEVLFSPSRIVKRGIIPWQLYVQVRALENRVPILASNVENNRYAGKSIIVDLIEDDGVIIPKKEELKGEKSKTKEFDLRKYKKSRKSRFSDSRKFS
ncbi:MAG TPA: carbon-nitrogen hydrolase family protein [Nitrosopumilaceae archaeon]|nr:carbon-nitrogen hydrolase family protein [Nitrosopumilaceae archaeon]